jgi:threonyl-tRNA synthetase
MIHRSLAGSMERLFAHLIEVPAGAFPAWYAPVQLAVLPVSPAQDDAARAVLAAAPELRAELSADGSLGARIRQAALRRVPYVGIVGEREAAAGQIALRLRDGREIPAQSVAEALARIGRVVDARSHDLLG